MFVLVPGAEEAGDVVNGFVTVDAPVVGPVLAIDRGRRRSHRTRTCPNAPLTRANRTRWALRSHIYSRIRDPDARCSCSVALTPPLSAPTAPIYALLAAASAFLLPPYSLPTAAFDIPHPTSPPNPSHTTPLSHLSTAQPQTLTTLCRLLTLSHHTCPLARFRGTCFPDSGVVHGAAQA